MLREGRFGKSMDSEAAEYQTSLKEDIRLFDSVIQVNMAHVAMLGEKDIIGDSEADQIFNSLSKLREEGLEALDMRPELEDIHMVVEEYVKDDLGEEVAGNMHAAKSRNDQVATAIRIVLREEVLEVKGLLLDLIGSLIDLARDNKDTVMPGYTHLQVAEPTTFGHYLSAYAHAFMRDVERLNETYDQVNECPLGSCAFAGTSFPIDRRLTSELLGFDGLVENTMDATSSRDFALKVMSDLSLLMTNLSRFAEELVIWSSSEFDMVNIPDEFSSTSSIMPQKKNPVTAELGRAKASRTFGNLVGGLSIMKKLPQAYNLDLQELTPLLWDSVDQSKSSVKVMGKLVDGLEPNPEKMKENAENGFASLTELANTLVKESDVPFRKAHSIVGKLASKANEEEKSLGDISISDLENASEKVIDEKLDFSEEKLEDALDVKKCVERRNLLGGPSSDSVADALSRLTEKLESFEGILDMRKNQIAEAEKELENLRGRIELDD